MNQRCQPATGSERCSSNNVYGRGAGEYNKIFLFQKAKLLRTFLAPRSFMPALQMDELRQKIGLISTFLKVTLVHRTARSGLPRPRPRPRHTPRQLSSNAPGPLAPANATGRSETETLRARRAVPGVLGCRGPLCPEKAAAAAPAALFVFPGSGPGVPKNRGGGPGTPGRRRIHSPSLSALTSRDMPFRRST